MRYPELVEDSASLYVAHLQGIHETLSPGGKFASQCLIDTLEAARLEGEGLDPTQATATWRQMAAASIDDADGLLNQWQLGYGRDDAPVIAVGTEHAYELRPPDRHKHPMDVGLAEITAECLVAAIWLCNSRPDVLTRMLLAPWWNWQADFAEARPYHVYTADYYRTGSRATWPTLGRDILLGGADWRTVLGQRCYQIELSGYPVLQSSGGREPARVRIDFLKRVVTAMRDTARVLILHGTPKFTEHDPRVVVAASFLGVDVLGQATGRGADSDDRRWEIYDRNGWRVIFSRALSGTNVSSEYLALISKLVADVVPLA
jgi:hypothetical protein